VKKNYDAIEYQQACKDFSEQFVCRIHPFPDCLKTALKNRGEEVYYKMNGPSYFEVTGTLKSFIIPPDQLQKITVPVFLACGRYDIITPELLEETVEQHLQDSQLKIFENSANMCHLEETEAVISEIGAFLVKAEKKYFK